jgi:hypothetical protein
MALQNFVEAIYFGKIKIKYIKIKGIRMVGTAEKTRAPYTLRLPHEWWPLAVARPLRVCLIRAKKRPARPARAISTYLIWKP